MRKLKKGEQVFIVGHGYQQSVKEHFTVTKSGPKYFTILIRGRPHRFFHKDWSEETGGYSSYLRAYESEELVAGMPCGALILRRMRCQ